MNGRDVDGGRSVVASGVMIRRFVTWRRHVLRMPQNVNRAQTLAGLPPAIASSHRISYLCIAPRASYLLFCRAAVGLILCLFACVLVHCVSS